MATYDTQGNLIEELEYPRPDSASFTGQYITGDEPVSDSPALDPGGTLLGNLPEDLTPEEAEAIREQRVAAYAGPDFEAGTAELPSSVLDTPVAPESSPYITPEATVADQLRGLLETGSPLMTLAEQRSQEEAQQMGLLSSSMAVGAGQKALYESALPIAQQDAAAYSAINTEQYRADVGFMAGAFEGDIQSFLNTQESKNRLINAAQEGQIQKELQDDAQRHQQILQQMDQDFRGELISFQESESYRRLVEELASREGMAADELQAKLEMHTLDIISATNIKNAEMANTMAMHMMEMDSVARQSYMSAAENLATNFNNALAHINGIPDSQISPANKDKYINGYTDSDGEWVPGLVDRYSEQLAFLSSIMGGSFDAFDPATGGGGGTPIPAMPQDAPEGHAYRFNQSTWTWELYQVTATDTQTPPPPPQEPDTFTPPPGDTTPMIDQADPTDYWVYDQYGNKIKNPNYQAPGEEPVGEEPVGEQPAASTTYPGKVDANPGQYYDQDGNLHTIPDGWYIEGGQLVEEVVPPAVDETGTETTWTGTDFVAPAGYSTNIVNPSWASISPLMTDTNSSFYNLTSDQQRTAMTTDLTTMYEAGRANGGYAGMTNTEITDRMNDIYAAFNNADDPTAAYQIYQQLQSEVDAQQDWYNGLDLNTNPWMAETTDMYGYHAPGEISSGTRFASSNQIQTMNNLYGWGQYDNVLNEAMNTGLAQQLHPDAQAVYDDWMQMFGWSDDYKAAMAANVKDGTGYAWIHMMQAQVASGDPTARVTSFNTDFEKAIDPATGAIVDPYAIRSYSPYTADPNAYQTYLDNYVGTRVGGADSDVPPEMTVWTEPNGNTHIAVPSDYNVGQSMEVYYTRYGTYAADELYTSGSDLIWINTANTSPNYAPKAPTGYTWKLLNTTRSTTYGGGYGFKLVTA
jgi:hypothetical protein